MDMTPTHETHLTLIAREVNLTGKHHAEVFSYVVTARFGQDYGLPTTYHRLMIDGIDASYWIDCKPQQVGASDHWSARLTRKTHYTGRWIYNVGKYGDRTTFTTKKADHSLPYDRIASILIGLVGQQRREEAAQRLAKANVGCAQQVADALGIKYSYMFRVSPSTKVTGKVNVKLDGTFLLSVDRAIELGNVLKSFGLTID